MATTKTGKRRSGIGQIPDVSLRGIFTHLLKFVRTDFGGGKNHQTVIPQRLQDAGIPVSPDTEAAYRLGAERTRDTIKSYLTPQVKTARGLLGF